MDAIHTPYHWRRVVLPLACLAKNWPSTNRIRSHSARIKATEPAYDPLWRLRKLRMNDAGRGNQDTSGP